MDGEMRTELTNLHVICFLLLLGSGDFQVRGLTVTGKDDPIEALRGEDVTIPCLLSGVPIPLNLQILSVVWTRRLQKGPEYEVYGIRGSHHQSQRPGSHMNDSDLKQGNASLYIPNIQITDEGEYHCLVIVTPNDGSATSTLHVSVKPQITIHYMRIIEAGFTGDVYCEVRNVYPEDVKIKWLKQSKGTTTNTSLDEDVSITKQIRNSDGTYNVTKVLTVRPATRDKSGDVFSCIVSHRSLKEEISLNFTMPGRSPVMYIVNALLLLLPLLLLTFFLKTFVRKGWRPWIYVLCTGIILSLIPLLCFFSYFMVNTGDFPMWVCIPPAFVSILLLIPLGFYVRLLWKYFTIGNLTVAKISGDYYIYHMKKTTLTCQITDFRKKEIQINVYLKRRKDINKHLITSWESTSNNSSNDLPMAGDQSDNNFIVLTLLQNGADCGTLLPVEMEVKMTKFWIGMYECLCSINITPSADTDNGAVLCVEVEHASLKRPVYVRRTLNVLRTVVGKSIISDISGETWIPHMKRTNLSCQITGFIPKEIQINLYLKRCNDMKNHLIYSWVSVGRPSGEDNITTLPVEMKVEKTKTEDGSYKCDCRISLTPNADRDDGAVLTVEVTHTALQWPIYKYHILNVIKGDKPGLWRRLNLRCSTNSMVQFWTNHSL